MSKFHITPVGKQIVSTVGSVPTGQGTYQGLYDANPYVNQNYTKSPWQKFLSGLGFRTEADAWQENMAVQASEYNAQIAQKQYDEEYNLPINQVQRMKAAGLNPDISGGDSIEPGSAQNLGEDPSTPMQSTGEESVPFEIANGVMSCFSSALGICSSIQGIQRNRLENKLLSLQNEQGMSDFVSGIASMFAPRSDESEVWDNVEIPWQNLAIDRAKAFGLNLPKNLQPSFTSNIENYFSGLMGDVRTYEDFKKRVQERKGYYMERNTLYDEADDVLQIIAKEFGDAQVRLIKSSQSAQTAENVNSAEYFQSLDASQQAGAENAQNKLSETNATAVQIMNEALGNIIDGLKQKSEEGGFKGGLASVALALLSAFRLYVTSVGLPSISRSSSSGGSSWSNGAGSASHSSQSISIGF